MVLRRVLALAALAVVLLACGDAAKEAVATSCKDKIYRDYMGSQKGPVTWADVGTWTQFIEKVNRPGLTDYYTSGTFTDSRGKWAFNCTVEYKNGYTDTFAFTMYIPGSWYLDEGQAVPR